MNDDGAGWFQFAASNAGVEVTFELAPDRNWPVEVLVRRPLPAERFTQRRVTFAGPGAVWMYAYSAASAVAAGADEVFVYQPGERDLIQVYPLPSAVAPSDLTWFREQVDAVSGVTMTFLPARDRPRWPTSVRRDIPALLERLRAGGEGTVCVTGPGAGWMYATVAAEACRQGYELVSCLIPREYDDQAIVVHGPDGPGALLPLPPPHRPRPGTVLGVVGDPNCGKSVLATTLYNILVAEHILGWKLDCDVSSPTPNWYLNLVQQGDVDTGSRLRKAQKRPWSAPMEDSVCRSLERLRRHLDLIIADLPGGDHRPRPPRRFSEYNSRMLAAVDAFIVIGQVGESGADDWLAELERHGLRERVVAVIESADPEYPPSCSLALDGGIERGRIEGLDRATDPRALVAACGPCLAPLVRQLLGDGEGESG